MVLVITEVPSLSKQFEYMIFYDNPGKFSYVNYVTIRLLRG